VRGAAHTGSGASSRLDHWSDIDLALSLQPDTSYEQVVAEWTERLYRHHGAVAHVEYSQRRANRRAIRKRAIAIPNNSRTSGHRWEEARHANILL